jgi:hypothetical protein
MASSRKAIRLLNVVASIERRLEGIPSPPLLEEHGVIVDVAKTYMYGILKQGRAIALLADSGVAECAYSNLRSMFEAYVDLRYLLMGDQKASALRVVLYAIHDLIAGSDQAGIADSEARAGALDLIESWGQEDPATLNAFKADWDGRRRGHWSGMSRTALIRHLDPDPRSLLVTYKALSWESHGVLSAILDHMRESPSSGATHQYRDPQPRVADFTCTQAVVTLMASWRGLEAKLPRL